MRIILDGARVRELRKKRGWDQVQLAETSGLSSRTIRNVEASRPVSLATAELVAEALEVPVSELQCALLPSWQSVPSLGDEVAEGRLREARRAAMEGKHDKAVTKIEEVLAAKEHQLAPAVRLELRLMAAVMLDEGGRQPEALDVIGDILADLGRTSDVPPELPHWVEHHRGIALRRGGRLSEAREVFEGVIARARDLPRIFLPSAWHQLGVVELEAARGASGEERAARVERAIECLETADAGWLKTPSGAHLPGEHRRGFTQRRLAEGPRPRRQGTGSAPLPVRRRRDPGLVQVRPLRRRDPTAPGRGPEARLSGAANR